MVVEVEGEVAAGTVVKATVRPPAAFRRFGRRISTRSRRIRWRPSVPRPAC